MDVALKLEKWLYETLKLNLQLAVFNYLPKKPPSPCIHIAEVTSNPWLVRPESEEVHITLRVYSDKTSNEEVLRLAGLVKAALVNPGPEWLIKVRIVEIHAHQVRDSWVAEMEMVFYILC